MLRETLVQHSRVAWTLCNHTGREIVQQTVWRSVQVDSFVWWILFDKRSLFEQLISHTSRLCHWQDCLVPAQNQAWIWSQLEQYVCWCWVRYVWPSSEGGEGRWIQCVWDCHGLSTSSAGSSIIISFLCRISWTNAVMKILSKPLIVGSVIVLSLVLLSSSLTILTILVILRSGICNGMMIALIHSSVFLRTWSKNKPLWGKCLDGTFDPLVFMACFTIL